VYPFLQFYPPKPCMNLSSPLNVQLSTPVPYKAHCPLVVTPLISVIIKQASMRVSETLYNNTGDSRPKQHARMSYVICHNGRHATATRCLPVELLGVEEDGTEHAHYTSLDTRVFTAHEKTPRTEQFIIHGN